MEKQYSDSTLPFPSQSAAARPSSRWGIRKLTWATITLAATYIAATHLKRWAKESSVPPVSFGNQCVQPDALVPKDSPELAKAFDYISSAAFRNASIERLSGAVKIRTESFDDLGPIGDDERWEVFYGFHEYLVQTFPLVHEKLQVEKINTHGLLYTWQGSNADLKATTLMAHQDTVPVPADTNQLIATLETVELLLQAKFEPRRTLLLAYGFDEEISGYHGAAHISAALHDRYGDDGLAVIVDEGATFEKTWGTVFAKPGAAEKGATDVTIAVRSPGGHSSIPHDHTSIGILSELVYLIESTQYPTRLYDENPYFAQLICGAKYSPKFDPQVRKLLDQRLQARNTCSAKKDALAIEAAKSGPEIKYLLQTSQAVDLISGGAKVNALPERAQAVVNHRINVGETVEVVFDHLTKVAAHVAEKHGLKLHAFDGVEEPSSIILTHSDYLNPAPVSPSDGSSVTPFSVLAGTVRAIYGDAIITTPGIMTGNTDTRFFWDLTKHIFRFGPGYDPEDTQEGLGSIHTVNERVSVVNHINAVKWFTLFIRNLDEADL